MTRLLPRLFCSFTEVGDLSKQHMFHISAQRQLLFTSWQCQLSPTTLLQGVKWHWQRCNYLAICFLSPLIMSVSDCFCSDAFDTVTSCNYGVLEATASPACVCMCILGEMHSLKQTTTLWPFTSSNVVILLDKLNRSSQWSNQIRVWQREKVSTPERNF